MKLSTYLWWSLITSIPFLPGVMSKKEASPAPPQVSGKGFLRSKVTAAARSQLGSSDAAKFWADASPRVNMFGADWCGAFALWALHQAGLALDWEWEPSLGFLMTKKHQLPITKKPEPGDIAYFEHNQHHAVVAEVTDTDVTLINGNGAGGVVTEVTVPRMGVTAFFSIGPLLDAPATLEA